MTDDVREKYDMIIKMSYAVFSNQPCTPPALKNFIGMVQPQLAECAISEEVLYTELERLHTISVLDSSIILDDHSDHIEWFNPSTNVGLNRQVEWHFWSHYKEYLAIGKKWPSEVVESIDRETSQILSRLEDPERPGMWDRRGMVMGSVQSGKTANYTGLIAKAIDAGYKLIVVLAGVHNSLRSQTQARINDEILGYDLDKVQQFQGQAVRIGVRAMFTDHRIVQTLTNSSEAGDFRKMIANTAGIVPSSSGDATILIVKKHVSILKNLIDWSTAIRGEEDDTGRRIVTGVPLLVIDDESDYASINTKRDVKDEDGQVLEECDPSTTNRRIRELLSAFRKSTYIGYSATPFANILIPHDVMHLRYGEDLFPRNFIISLPQSSNYIGPDRVFGLDPNLATGDEGADPLPLLCPVDDYEEFIPDQHKIDLLVTGLPESLKHAIKVFLLSTAVRFLRRSSPHHNSMLVHVTRFTNVQRQVGELVEKELQRLIGRIQNSNDALLDFLEIWKRNFIPTTDELSDEFDLELPDWSDVRNSLYTVTRRVKMKLINGQAADALEYRLIEMQTKNRLTDGEKVPWVERGEYVIAIGGDKLSRGLTLEGLTVSYYLRASRMYDTLMQMGRWFGYRDGYLDVCRIYTNSTLIDWYRHIATASLELRGELEYMALLNKEPKEFGLKVLSHPGQLAVTSAGKMRNAENLSLSYAGRISETIVFDPAASQINMQELENLVRNLDMPTGNESGRFHWKNVDPEVVRKFPRKLNFRQQFCHIL